MKLFAKSLHMEFKKILSSRATRTIACFKTGTKILKTGFTVSGLLILFTLKVKIKMSQNPHKTFSQFFKKSHGN